MKFFSFMKRNFSSAERVLVRPEIRDAIGIVHLSDASKLNALTVDMGLLLPIR
jgi:enoyl-CoA hydratase/carnithine racemase